MDMPGVVFVLGCDPECWLVELNQPAHKLNFQHTYFEDSFKLMVGMLFINLPLFPINFATRSYTIKHIEHESRKPRHN